jgi:hypothetical protein
MDPRMRVQPGLHDRMLVGAVVVDNQTVQLARGERRLATQPPRTTDPHVANLHGALLDATGIHQLSDAERALISERGLSQWSECRHLLPGATSVVREEAAEAS